MTEHEHKPSPLSKWALGIAQGLILAGLGWFGKQQLDMHDQLNQVTWEIQSIRGNAADVRKNTLTIQSLDYRVQSLEKRQDRDETIRERAREASH